MCIRDSTPLGEMTDRSREVFRRLVETYLDTGEPVGSRTLARTLTEGVSAATVRNVMQDLEEHGLLIAPHTSAGRLPTERGLRFFVDGILEIGDVSPVERAEIERSLGGEERDVAGVLGRAAGLLSEADLAALEREIAAEIADAVAFAERGTLEPAAELTRFVTSEEARR